MLNFILVFEVWNTWKERVIKECTETLSIKIFLSPSGTSSLFKKSNMKLFFCLLKKMLVIFDQSKFSKIVMKSLIHSNESSIAIQTWMKIINWKWQFKISEISHNSQENTCARVSFLLKQRLWHRSFPVIFAKFLRTPFLQNTSGRLLLKF